MGDEQKVPYEQLLADARDAYDGATDFTVAVEEEFALLDSETLELVNRFEDIQAAARDFRHPLGGLGEASPDVESG